MLLAAGRSLNPTTRPSLEASFSSLATKWKPRGTAPGKGRFYERSESPRRIDGESGDRPTSSRPSGDKPRWSQRNSDAKVSERRATSERRPRTPERSTRETERPSSSYERTRRAPDTPRDPNQYRSKHFDPSVERPTNLPKLEPHVLSGRLKKLCEEGRLEAAIGMLKNAPRDAQNAPVWNTVIWECMKAKQFQQSFQLYTDMKRRGHSPSVRTYQTMFNGLSRIDDWSAYPKQLKNADTLFQSYMRLMESLFAEDPAHPDISSAPLSLYLKVLGDAGRYQDVFDVYYNLDADGPVAPDHLVFTAMFQALSPLKLPYGVDVTSTVQQNASSAKLLWTQMMRSSKKMDGFKMDSHLVASAIIALSKGRTADQDFAFTIARDYLGLPVEPSQTKVLPPVSVSTHTLAAVLLLCQSSERFQLAVDIFDSVKKRRNAFEIIDRAHVEEVMKARQSLTPVPESAHYEFSLLDWMLVTEATHSHDPKRKEPLRPRTSTLLLVLGACWRTKDWTNAIKAFQLMSGIPCHSFMDGVERPPKAERHHPRILPPTSENVSLLVRTALASENRASMRQALRLVRYIGLDALALNARPTLGYDPPKSKKALKHTEFHSEKLATAVLDTLDCLSKNSCAVDRPKGEDLERWRELKELATAMLSESSDSRLIPIKDAKILLVRVFGKDGTIPTPTLYNVALQWLTDDREFRKTLEENGKKTRGPRPDDAPVTDSETFYRKYDYSH